MGGSTVNESVTVNFVLKTDKSNRRLRRYFYGTALMTPAQQAASFLAREQINFKWFEVIQVTRKETVVQRSA